MKEQDTSIIFRLDGKQKNKLKLIAKDKGIKPSELYRRMVRDFINQYEQRGY